MTEDPHRSIVLSLGAVQFVNILDFIIVMPLGPDFATALDIPVSHLGYIGGAYTAAACLSGLAGAFFLDRFDRRSALSVAMLGLVLGTLGGAFAQGFVSLMVARTIAGAFGGPATSLAYAIIADVVPAERRGKAMGALMGAFSLASIVGVPAGLELARQGGWRLPFIAVALLGAVFGTYAHARLPPMFGHVVAARARPFGRDILELFRFDLLLSLTMTFMMMCSVFVFVPNISTYLLFNLHYPRSQLGTLYLVGGAVSLVGMRAVGALVDRFGSALVGTFGVLLVTADVYLGFVCAPPLVPIMAGFAGYMLANAFRTVAYNTLASRVPRSDERARFSSMQSSVQHLASALGAFGAAQLVSELADHSLVGEDRAALVSIAFGFALLPFLWVVQRRVARAASAAAAARA